MIPILYEKTETEFGSNGLGRLRDCTKCEVVEERNGVYECDFDYPVDGAHFDDIQLGRIIGVEHDETQDVQPFDIVSYSRPIDGVVSFHAVHISYRQSKLTASGTNINSLSDAFSMLAGASPNNPFMYWTDKTSTGFMASADGTPYSVRQLLGGVEGSILDAYGGEYEWDKFTVKLWGSRGTDRTLTIRYGVNMLDYTDDTDSSEVYNAVVPFWKGDDTVVTGSMISSGRSTDSGRVECIPLDLTDKFETQPTVTQLESYASSYMTGRQTNLSTKSIKVDFVRLTDSAEYARFAKLQECKLCDTVNVVFPRYNTSGRFKIVKTEYDVLLERFTSLELGTLSTTLAEALGVGNGMSSNGGSSPTIDVFYPVGSYYETSDTSFDPNVAWGGTWVLETAGQVHVSAGTGYSVSGALSNTSDGGSKDAIVPYHNHGFTQPTISSSTSGYYILGSTGTFTRYNVKQGTGTQVSNVLTAAAAVTRDGAKATGGAVAYAGTSGNAANANMQPYIVVNRWHRTA